MRSCHLEVIERSIPMLSIKSAAVEVLTTVFYAMAVSLMLYIWAALVNAGFIEGRLRGAIATLSVLPPLAAGRVLRLLLGKLPRHAVTWRLGLACTVVNLALGAALGINQSALEGISDFYPLQKWAAISTVCMLSVLFCTTFVRWGAHKKPYPLIAEQEPEK